MWAACDPHALASFISNPRIPRTNGNRVLPELLSASYIFKAQICVLLKQRLDKPSSTPSVFFPRLWGGQGARLKQTACVAFTAPWHYLFQFTPATNMDVSLENMPHPSVSIKPTRIVMILANKRWFSHSSHVVGRGMFPSFI